MEVFEVIMERRCCHELEVFRGEGGVDAKRISIPRDRTLSVHHTGATYEKALYFTPREVS